MAIEKRVGESTGIYRTETIGTFRHDSPAEDMEVLHQLLKAGNDLDGKLSAWESDAQEILKGHGLTFPAALFANGEPITKTAAQLIAEIGNLRTKLASPTPDVRAIALQALRVGQYFEQLGVRPFEALVRKAKGRVIHRDGRSCIVTDFEHRIVEYMDHRTEAPLADFVKHVWGDHYNKKNQNRYAKALSVFNTKLFVSGIPVSLSIRDDRLIRDLPKPA